MPKLVREGLKWFALLAVEETVRNLMPYYLPFVWLIVLIYATWEVLEWKPVRAFAESAYLGLRPRQKMYSYVAIFIMGGALLCFY